jgi:hypothetical protein
MVPVAIRQSPERRTGVPGSHPDARSLAKRRTGRVWRAPEEGSQVSNEASPQTHKAC